MVAASSLDKDLNLSYGGNVAAAKAVGEAVAKKAQEQGLAQAEEKDMAKAVRDLKWYPKY